MDCAIHSSSTSLILIGIIELLTQFKRLKAVMSEYVNTTDTNMKESAGVKAE